MLIESMRNIGYTLETALADIIDNSITAFATKIWLYADTTADHPKIAVLDNGEGMTEENLLEAMRPGSRHPLDTRGLTDLGRFGLGLKTASFSQCRRLTVVTRHQGVTSAAIWDLSIQKDEWLVQIPDDTSSIQWVERLGNHGTLVLWEDLDRIIDPDDSDNGIPHFVRRIDETREHLELVFHRYLAGEPGLKKIQIFLNDRPLEPFDPFHSSHPATIHGPVESIKVGRHEVLVQTFTLPHHKKVSSDEWERYAGRAGYLKNQGFYVYRGKRLIIHGTWFGLARQMELTKLARVRIDMPNGLDSRWKIDIKKASAHPPLPVKERLRRIIETIGATSKRVYVKRGHILITENRLPVWNRVQSANQIVYQVNTEHPFISNFISQLPAKLRADFARVLELTGSTLPMDALFADLGGAPERVSGNATTLETLEHTFAATIDHLQVAGLRLSEIEEMLRTAEPFCSNWDYTQELFATMTRKGAKND